MEVYRITVFIRYFYPFKNRSSFDFNTGMTIFGPWSALKWTICSSNPIVLDEES